MQDQSPQSHDQESRMATMVLFRARDMARTRSRGRQGVASHLMTRTCMKVGVVDDRWKPAEGANMPGPNEWWIVHVVHETNPGLNKGCLILRPISIVDHASINPLIPGFYSSVEPNPGTLIVTPRHDPGGPWFLPFKLKSRLAISSGYSSVIVNLGGAYWGKGEMSFTMPESEK